MLLGRDDAVFFITVLPVLTEDFPLSLSLLQAEQAKIPPSLSQIPCIPAPGSSWWPLLDLPQFVVLSLALRGTHLEMVTRYVRCAKERGVAAFLDFLTKLLKIQLSMQLDFVVTMKMLIHGQPVVHPDPQVVFCKATSQSSYPILHHELVLSKVQVFAEYRIIEWKRIIE